MTENAAANAPAAGNVVQEKLEAMKPVIGEMGRKLETTAGPAIGAVEEKLNVRLDKKKLGIIAAAAAVVVVVLILLLKGGGNGPGAGFGSPEKAFDAWMTGYCLHDFDLTLQAEPDFVIKYEGGEASLKNTLQRSYNNDIAQRSNAGFFKFEAVGHVTLEKSEREKLEQALNDNYGVHIKISDAARIEHRLVDLTDDSGKNTGATGTSGYAFKYKGNWYYLNIGSL